MEEAPPSYAQLTCSKAHHTTQPLMFVCLDYHCDNHTPICYSCKKEGHANHNTQDIGFFYRKLTEQLSSKTLKEVETLQCRLSGIRQSCLEALQKQRARIANLFAQVEEVIANACETLTERITVESSRLRQSIERNANSARPKSYDEFCQSIELNVSNYHRNLLCEKELQSETQLIVTSVQTCSKTLDEYLRRMTKEADGLNDQLTKAFSHRFQYSFDRLFPTVDTRYHWSTELKFKAIDVHKGHAQISKDFNILARGLTTPKFIKEQVGVLMENPLMDGRELAYTWKLKIHKLQYLIGFGICLKKKAISTEFQRVKWQQPGHGHYVVEQDGVVYSHSDSEVNGKQLGFTFKEQDVLTILYDTVSRVITISKGCQRFEMSVAAAGQGDCYHPCAYLTRTDNIFKNGESVQIVETLPA